MGLAASQVTLLTLTARRIDLEDQGQSINQQRLNIAAQEEQLATNYSNALSKTQLQVNAIDSAGDSLELSVTPENLQNYANTVVVDSTGKPIDMNTAANYIQQGLQDGQYQTYTLGTDGGHYDTTTQSATYGEFVDSSGTPITNLNQTSGTSTSTYAELQGYTEYNWNGSMPNGSVSMIQNASNTDGEEQAEATYESALGMIEPQDKMLEMNLKNIDTQHQAIQTEIDAVKKVIDKDIDGTFKTFAQSG